jgi:glutamine---fructose-6-phosphate transaminase (isomerizing)
MCGALGVEHIIVADDMQTKRRNIRLNLQAWLRKPHLGMIPLLTAGDKHFFTHANRISREMGIELIVFFENPFEQTRFKTGFLGVEERAGRVYDLKVWQSLQLAAHYLGEFVKNPGYINLSLLDTFKAFVASYGKSHPYLFPFQYVPWSESEVDTTLLHRYGWETSSDSVSTWRIGDGTAAFYNFVYYTVAGFTEFDTFRSNQIREGLMTRESALVAVASENRTRSESMQDYAQRVGVDCEEIVRVVENMPKLYPR